MAIRNGQETSSGNGRSITGERLVNGLGWFSIGLGLAEVLAPGAVAELIGASEGRKTRTLLRTYGLREIAAGVGILSQPQPAGWLWARVAGDMLDLAALASSMNARDSNRTRLATATAAVIGVTALDVLCSRELSRKTSAAINGDEGTRRVVKTIVINRAQENVYQYWRDLGNLPNFLSNLESVQVTSENHSHWSAKGPGGKRVEWDAEILEDEPNHLIRWRSLPGSDVDNHGLVRFERAPGGRGTMMRVDLRYDPPGGAIGATLAKLFGAEPGQQIDQDLRAFKQIMEIGEVVKSDASIHTGMHPAQPASWDEAHVPA
ncbi:MAG TPA: SRPBCC family protein [Bryobacteraceae bacterium]|nr:SRPBCC family protein [Bryobacteraceae bacterium]